jgi:hypothetical protein
MKIAWFLKRISSVLIYYYSDGVWSTAGRRSLRQNGLVFSNVISVTQL